MPKIAVLRGLCVASAQGAYEFATILELAHDAALPLYGAPMSPTTVASDPVLHTRATGT